jgi:hypothetical protein
VLVGYFNNNKKKMKSRKLNIGTDFCHPKTRKTVAHTISFPEFFFGAENQWKTQILVWQIEH